MSPEDFGSSLMREYLDRRTQAATDEIMNSSEDEATKALVLTIRKTLAAEDASVPNAIMALCNTLINIVCSRPSEKDVENAPESVKASAEKERTTFSHFNLEAAIRTGAVISVLQTMMRLDMAMQPDAPADLRQALKETIDEVDGRDPTAPLN